MCTKVPRYSAVVLQLLAGAYLGVSSASFSKEAIALFSPPHPFATPTLVCGTRRHRQVHPLSFCSIQNNYTIDSLDFDHCLHVHLSTYLSLTIDMRRRTSAIKLPVMIKGNPVAIFVVPPRSDGSTSRAIISSIQGGGRSRFFFSTNPMLLAARFLWSRRLGQ